MFQLSEMTSAELLVKKSRFLATALPVASEGEAKAAIAHHSRPDANHNCWAWRIGQAYRFSDDGEPTGTAGRPILSAIDGQSVDNVAVVVTRWFGGVLLGTGGLVRAYGGAAAACLRAGHLMPIVATAAGAVHLQFSDLALVKARLSSWKDVRIADERFGDQGAEITIHFPGAEIDAISQLIADLTSGRARLSVEP